MSPKLGFGVSPLLAPVKEEEGENKAVKKCDMMSIPDFASEKLKDEVSSFSNDNGEDIDSLALSSILISKRGHECLIEGTVKKQEKK